MERNFFEDRMNDIYTSVQDGNLENYYALEDYLSERGYRDGFYGLNTEEGLDNVYDDEADLILNLY
jgi:hypothetical protein